MLFFIFRKRPCNEINSSYDDQKSVAYAKACGERQKLIKASSLNPVKLTEEEKKQQQKIKKAEYDRARRKRVAAKRRSLQE